VFIGAQVSSTVTKSLKKKVNKMAAEFKMAVKLISFFFDLFKLQVFIVFPWN
jgi:hypothetical protein